MAATGFSVDIETVDKIGNTAITLAIFSDIGLPGGVGGCGSSDVANTCDYFLGELTGIWVEQLLPSVQLWGQVIQETAAWCRLRDAALAALSSPDSYSSLSAQVPDIPAITTSGISAGSRFTNSGGPGLPWEPGNAGLGEFSATRATSRWLEELATVAVALASRFGEQLSALAQAWQGTVGAALHQTGTDILEDLLRFSRVADTVASGAELTSYAQQVEDIAQRSALVCKRLAAAQDAATSAGGALDQLARELTKKIADATNIDLDLSRQRSLSATQDEANTSARIASAMLNDLDQERRIADHYLVSYTQSLTTSLTGITSAPPSDTTLSAATSASKGTITPASFTSQTPGSASPTIDPYPDAGLGPMGIVGCYVWITATPLPSDSGSGNYGSRNPTASDRLTWIEAQIAARAMGLIWPHASDNLLHYLDGEGTSITLDVDTMLDNSASFRSIIDKHHYELINDAIEAAKANGATEPVTFPIRSQWTPFTFDNEDDRDWYLAVGSINYAITGDITVIPPQSGSSDWSYKINYNASVDDRYNWDSGKSTEIAGVTVEDSDLAALHEAGMAQEFDMYSESKAFSESGTW